MFLGNTLGVVLMLGSMLPPLSAKDSSLNVNRDIFAMSVDVINEKIYYWNDFDKTSRLTIYPSPIDYDISEDLDLAYNEIFDILGSLYPDETHNVYIDYEASFLTTNRRVNFGHVHLSLEHEEDFDNPVYWQSSSFINANNSLSNRGYQNSIYLGDWDMGSINYAYSSYCLGWYCENNVTSTSYANVELKLPYLLRVADNMTLEKENEFIYAQNMYYSNAYDDYFNDKVSSLTDELRHYKSEYESAQNTIDNLRWELDNGVENVFDWFKNVFNSFAGFLNMEIAPNVTIAMLLGIPLIGFALFFILKLTLS